jgi:hypothetical protein
VRRFSVAAQIQEPSKTNRLHQTEKGRHANAGSISFFAPDKLCLGPGLRIHRMFCGVDQLQNLIRQLFRYRGFFELFMAFFQLA